ncbi:MAG: hypothetical protein IJ230_07280, partial [Clostridia bacterium]|nr:hypothetical protein [Clostridia bacterium]
MADRNERYDAGTVRDLEELEKIYFQQVEPGSGDEAQPRAARRQSAGRSTGRRRSASNASRAQSRAPRTRNKTKSERPSLRRRGEQKAPARSKTAQADAGKANDKLVFTPLPPEGYEEPAKTPSASQVRSEASTAAKKALDNLGKQGAIYISDTKRSMEDIRRRTA